MIGHISILFLILLIQTNADKFLNNNIDDNLGLINNKLSSFEPKWSSLDNRQLPSWYDEAKIGIFIHWGVYSVPSFGSEWFWINWKTENTTTKYHDFMKERYPPKFTYQDFARDFTAEFFNATQWADIFDAAGAKYIVLTSKHHEGYTLWPSSYSYSWNSVDVGPNRDLIGELSVAIRKKKHIKFGLYHSLFEWFHPLYLSDKKNNFTTNTFVTSKIQPEMRELIEKYKPEVFWSDGEWEAPDTYWNSKEFLAWLFNESPVNETIVVNDRWGQDTLCRHGSFYTCTDRYNPGQLQTHKWENAMTIDKKSWGFRRNAMLEDYFSTSELIKELASTVSCGGNLLMNVGPTKDGIISPIYEERLRDMGKWLKINGEAIYKTIPWHTQNDTITGDVWYTVGQDRRNLYGIMLTWPKDHRLKLGSVSFLFDAEFTILGNDIKLKWEKANKGIVLILPSEAHRGQPGWVIKIQFSGTYKNKFDNKKYN